MPPKIKNGLVKSLLKDAENGNPVARNALQEVVDNDRPAAQDAQAALDKLDGKA